MATLRTQYIPPKGRSKLLKDLNLTSANISIEGLGGSSSDPSGGGGIGTSWLEAYFTDGVSFLTLSKEIRMTGGFPIPTRVASIAENQLLYWKNDRISGSGFLVDDLLSRTVNEQISGSWYFTTRVQSRNFDVMRQIGGGTEPIAILQGRTQGGFIAGRRGVHLTSIDAAGDRHLAFLNWEESFISGKLAIGGTQRITPSPHTVHIAGSLGLTDGIAIDTGNLTIAGGNIILSDGSLQVSHSLNAGTDVNIARDLFVTRNVEVTGTTELKSRLTLSQDALHEHLHIKRGSAEASITLSSNVINVASLILRADATIENDIAISPAGNLTAAGNLYASGGTVGIGTGTSNLAQFFYSSSVFHNTFGSAVSYWDVYFGTTLHSRFIKGTGIQIRDGGLEIGYSGVPHYRQRIGGTSPNYYLDFTLVNNLTGFRWYFGENKRLELFANGDLGIFRNAVVGAALTVETTSLLKGAITGQSTMDITGLSRFNSDVSSIDTVTSGFGGSGWRIQKIAGSPNRYHFTIDRLTVRQTMDVYELVINQMRGTNGSLLVSDTAKISAVTIVSSSIWDVTVDTGGDTTLIPFVNGDLLMCSKWTASGLKYYEAIVSNINTANGTMRLTLTFGTSTAAVNDVVGRIDSSTPARRGYLYITSSDNNAPYLDVVYEQFTKVRLGNLAGIVDSVLGSLSGFGLYSDNVFLRGRFVVAGGGTTTNDVSTRGYTITLATDAQNSAISTAADDATAKANAAYNNALAGSEYYTDNQLSTFESSLGDLAFSDLIGKAQLDTTVISGGYLVNTLINTVWLQAQIITTTYIEGMTLNFQQGTIGGWKIDGNLLYTGLLSSNNELNDESHGIFLRSNEDGRSIVIKGLDANNTVRLYTSPSGGTWGITGMVAGSTIFQLGSINRIAGWNFTNSTFASQVTIPNTITPVMEINSSLRHFQIRVSTIEYIKMFYTNNTNWGIEHKYQNTSLFQLGSTNQIAGWHFGTDYMGKNSGGRFLVMSNNPTGNATVDGGNSYLRAGFGMYNHDNLLDPLVPAIKLIRVGVISNPDTAGTFPTTPIYGIQIGVRKPGVGYRDIFRSDSLGNSKIAGVNFDNESMWTDNWRLNADGTATFNKGKIGGWTIDTASIASENEFVRLHKTSGIVVSNATTTDNVFANNNRVNMYYFSPTDWGLTGRVGGNIIFRLGATNQIAGWTFEQNVMWAGSKWSTSVSTGGVSIGTRSDDRHFRAFLNSQNYVEMKYVSSSNWGVKGVSNGSTIFQLGNVNKIAGFTFDANSLTGTTLKISPNSLLFYSGAVDISEFVYSAGSGWSDTAWRTTGTSVYKAQIMMSKNKNGEGRLQLTAGTILIAADYNLQMYLPVGAGNRPTSTLYRDSNGYVRIVI